MRTGPALPPRPAWAAHAAAAASSLLFTAIASLAAGVLDPANLLMLYLLVTVGVALRWGRGPAALAAVLNVLAFDFVFVPPHLSFAVRDVQYLITFAVMLLVGLVTGQLTAGLQQQARIAARREQRARALFELAGALASALTAPEVAQRGAAALRQQFGGDALVLPNLHDRLLLPETPPAGFEPLRARALLEDAPAPQAAATGDWSYLPLAAPARVRGVLALRPAAPEGLGQGEERQHLETMARQIAIALERVHYIEIAQQTLVEMESERLRNALLAAMSHDVRTPLTALIGLAESLVQTPLAPAQAETAGHIAQQARSLAQLVNKLLDMARLQSGTIQLRLDWQSLEEVVGSALRGATPQLQGKQVLVRLPPDLPLVEFDAVLIERVLVNLLENAAKYGSGPIEISASAQRSELVVTVRDHGPGLPEAVQGHEGVLFEKFTRGQPESATPGVGLGLAICKAVLDAHRGTIGAANAAGGGAEFSFRLPRRTPPAAP